MNVVVAPDEPTLLAIAEKAAEIALARTGTVPEAREWLNVASAADYLDVTPERIRKLVTRREIPFHQEAPGCRILFRRRDLDSWLAGYRHEPRGGGA